MCIRDSLEESQHEFYNNGSGQYAHRGPKEIFATLGHFAGAQDFTVNGEGAAEIDTVTDIIFAHRYGPSGNRRSTVADFIAGKLIAYFAHPDPATGFVREVVDASGFAATWDLTALLRAIFVHDDFYLSAGPAAPGTPKSVKWPIDFVVGTLRLLNMRLRGKYQYIEAPPNYPNIRDSLINMGQLLFEPPSVFGWDWENAWVSSSTLLARYAFARDLTSARDGGSTSLRSEKLFSLTLSDPGAIVDAATALLGISDQLGAGDRAALIAYLTDHGAMPALDLTDYDVRHRKLHGLLATLIQSPAYQLH
jgi:hypothetical protein